VAHGLLVVEQAARRVWHVGRDVVLAADQLMRQRFDQRLGQRP
jgi:hypothetical protein